MSERRMKKIVESMKDKYGDRELNFLYQHIEAIESLLGYTSNVSVTKDSITVNLFAPQKVPTDRQLSDLKDKFEKFVLLTERKLSLLNTKFDQRVKGSGIAEPSPPESSTQLTSLDEDEVSMIISTTMEETRNQIRDSLLKAIQDVFNPPANPSPIVTPPPKEPPARIVDTPPPKSTIEPDSILQETAGDTDNQKLWKERIRARMSKQ